MLAMKILIIGVVPYSLTNFRGDLISTLSKRGHTIIAMACGASASEISKIEALGCKYIDCPIARTSVNPFVDIRTLLKLITVIKSENPSHILPYTIKPVIWTGIALLFFPSVKFIPLITGLGYAFGKGGLLRSMVKRLVTQLYRISLGGADAIIFQNRLNRQEFVDSGILTDQSNTFIVNGSGVNVDKFAYVPLIKDHEPIKFLMIARLLRDKGVKEYLEAAKIVKIQQPFSSFFLAGPPDDSPNAFSLEEIKPYVKSDVVTYLGPLTDVRNTIAECNVFVLPSYHEGMPRTVLESMAIGRAVITTDTAGCQETVIEGLNGWLVPAKNVEVLASRMIWFLENPKRIVDMGAASRLFAEERFEVSKINADIINILNQV
jgi:glycosyltransferase involved in cell wall biosynthesis